MEKEMICIVCPVGCHISVNTETYEVRGNACPRGAVYGKEELTAPKRVVTSTVKIKNALDKRCPVKTEKSKLNIEVCPYDEDPRKIALVANIPIVSPANRRK